MKSAEYFFNRESVTTKRNREISNAFIGNNVEKNIMLPDAIFLLEDGRKERYLIDIPDPAYSEGYHDLLLLVEELIESKDNSSVIAALGSIDVDIAYYDSIPGSKSNRQARRLWKVSERLAAHFFDKKLPQCIHYSGSLEIINGTLQLISEDLIKEIAKNPLILHKISSRGFEKLIAEIFKGFGWTVELTAASRDGGYDILAITKDTNLTGVRTSLVIECKKNSPHRKVGVEVARQLFSVKDELKASTAMLVTTSDFTKGVYDYKAKRLDFDTKNFNDIVSWCKTYTPRKP